MTIHLPLPAPMPLERTRSKHLMADQPNSQNPASQPDQPAAPRKPEKRRPNPINAISNIKNPLEGIKKFVRGAYRPTIEEVVHETTSGGIIFRRNEKTEELEILLIQDA